MPPDDCVYRLIPETEFAARRQAGALAARERGLDGFLAWGRGGVLDGFSDVAYFTNHFDPVTWVPPLPGIWSAYANSALIWRVDDEGALIVTAFCSSHVYVEDVRTTADISGEVVSALRDYGLSDGMVGLIGSEVMPDACGQRIRSSLPQLSLVPADEISQELRLRLSANEIAALQEAGRVGSNIVAAAAGAAVPGGTEGDAIAAASSEASRCPGCAQWWFLASGGEPSLVASTALPPWRPDHRYEEGEVVHLDCYGYVGGYIFDIGRTLAVGAVDDAQTQLCAIAKGACDAMRSALRPGVTPRELHETGTSYFRQRGVRPVPDFPSALPPAEDYEAGFGHAIGAGFFRPYITPLGPDANTALEPACGLAFEVFVTDGNGRYAFHEDNYVMEDGGVVTLSANAPHLAT